MLNFFTVKSVSLWGEGGLRLPIPLFADVTFPLCPAFLPSVLNREVRMVFLKCNLDHVTLLSQCLQWSVILYSVCLLPLILPSFISLILCFSTFPLLHVGFSHTSLFTGPGTWPTLSHLSVFYLLFSLPGIFFTQITHGCVLACFRSLVKGGLPDHPCPLLPVHFNTLFSPWHLVLFHSLCTFVFVCCLSSFECKIRQCCIPSAWYLISTL